MTNQLTNHWLFHQFFFFLTSPFIFQKGSVEPLYFIFSAMRIQFCKSNLLNAYELINEGHANIPRPLQLVKIFNPVYEWSSPFIGRHITYKNNEVLKENDYFALVMVNFAGGICYIQCHSGFCAATNMNKKGMPRSAKLNESAKLCSHLETGYRNINCINSFPRLLQRIECSQWWQWKCQHPRCQHGRRDIKQRLSNFDKETGLWSYRSGTVNLNTVNLKFHLIRSFCEIFARFLLFHV